MKVLLCIMHARDIPVAIQSYEALDCDLAWMSGFYEKDLVAVHADIVQGTDYDAYVMVSDDVVVTQEAMDAVTIMLYQGHPAVTGWCSLVQHHRKVNLCREPLKGNVPNPWAYRFYTRGQVLRQSGKHVITHFMGMSLTGMPRDMWLEFPFDVFEGRNQRGVSSDFHLSMRLRDAGVPMVAPKAGEVEHLKQRMSSWQDGDDQRLLVGEIEPEVKMRTREQNKMQPPKPNKQQVQPKHVGGGWYVLPDGRKVQGKDQAALAMKGQVR